MSNPGDKKSDLRHHEEFAQLDDEDLEAVCQIANDKLEKRRQQLPILQRQRQTLNAIYKNTQALSWDKVFSPGRIALFLILTATVSLLLYQTGGSIVIVSWISVLPPLTMTWMISRQKAWMGLDSVLSYGYMVSAIALSFPMAILAFVNLPLAIVTCQLLFCALIALNIFEFTSLFVYYLMTTRQSQAS